jgi:hypothetical protein
LNSKIPALRIRRPQAEANAEVRLWSIERQRNPPLEDSNPAGRTTKLKKVVEEYQTSAFFNFQMVLTSDD